MKNKHRLLSRLNATFLLLILHISLPAMAYDFTANVFKFQQKLANLGDASAQYKLGIMYETGHGTNINFDEALNWYKKSAGQNHKAALRRIGYIQILNNGYKPAIHEKWVTNLKQDANNQNGDAMLLLGIMHKNGTAVNKDMHKAKKLLKQAAIKDIPGAAEQIEAIFILEENKKANEYALKQKQLAKENLARIKNEEAKKKAELKKRQLAKQKEALEKEKIIRKKKSPPVQSKAKLIKKITKKTVPVEKKAELSWIEAVEKNK